MLLFGLCQGFCQCAFCPLHLHRHRSINCCPCGDIHLQCTRATMQTSIGLPLLIAVVCLLGPFGDALMQAMHVGRFFCDISCVFMLCGNGGCLGRCINISLHTERGVGCCSIRCAAEHFRAVRLLCVLCGWRFVSTAIVQSANHTTYKSAFHLCPLQLVHPSNHSWCSRPALYWRKLVASVPPQVGVTGVQLVWCDNVSWLSMAL